MRSPVPDVWDVIVVGGGPVGLATALYADRAGLSVTVVERRATPIDKACGEGLMPGALRALQGLDVDPTGHPFFGIRYVGGGRSAEAHFRAGPGRGVRRTTLHQALREAVAARRIPVAGDAVEAIRQHADVVEVAGLTGRHLIGADGLHSSVRRLAGLEVTAKSTTTRRSARSARYGQRRHYRIAPWSDLVEVHWGDRFEAYVTPVANDLVGVALLTSRREPFDVQLKELPALVERLDQANPPGNETAGMPNSSHGKILGAGPLRQRSRSRVVGRVLLVGDAAGYVDALTGEGIAVGLASASAAVEAIATGTPTAYERNWWRLSRRYRWITEGLLWARSHRSTARLIVPGAQRIPGLMATAVNQLAH
jgi:flavin-dependent dehydrogenase